jgi:hypothetical protein
MEHWQLIKTLNLIKPIFIGSLKFSQAYQTVLHILPINSLMIIIFKNSDHQIQQFHWS